jgi:tetrahydrodipicolinate N-succinyltransferase
MLLDSGLKTEGFSSNTVVPHVGEEIIIEDNVWIGAGSIILPGVKVGRGSIIGAGAVVTKNVDCNTIVAGNPARQIGWTDGHCENSEIKRGLGKVSEFAHLSVNRRQLRRTKLKRTPIYGADSADDG